MHVHCGYLFFLILVLRAELAAGMVIRKDSTDSEMQSIIEDLQAALTDYSGLLKEASYLKDLPVLPCTDTAAHLEQSSTVALRLSEYQRCAKQLGAFCPDNGVLCRVVTLNNDLLQHLSGSDQDLVICPPSSPSSSAPADFDSIRKSIQCVHCWSQQVAALRR